MPSPSANPTPITPPRVPLIDERTGLIERSWYMFFLSLFRVAQGSGTELMPDTSSLVSSYDAALTALAQEVQTTPPTYPPIAESQIQNQVSQLEAQVAELAKMINDIAMSLSNPEIPNNVLLLE